MKLTVLRLLVLLLLLPLVSRADNPVDVEDYLRRFHENPSRVMNDRLPKWSEGGELATQSKDVSVEEKGDARRELLSRSRSNLWSEIPDSERPDDLLAGIRAERRLTEMEKKGLKKSYLDEKPWSGSYWPTRNGALSWRYNDPAFPGKDFKTNYSSYEARPAETLPDEQLSPAEKYDILVGDANFTLTKENWARGLEVVKTKPDVPKWYGLCHGWAPAAYLEHQPRKAVTVPARSGRMITFLPADIKALASSLWADTIPDVIFIGKKCVKPKPKEDDMGRVIDPECFNTNPGTWHLTLVNRIGVGRESFVMDATYDTEVWNQPIYGYKYSYFNPQTLKVSDSLFGSIVEKDKFKLDKFKKYRSAKAKYVVGIALDITYVNEIQPHTGTGADRAVLKTVRYIYDLELDAGHQIIGGEWYSNKHPDFIWAVEAGFNARSIGEKRTGLRDTWNGQAPVSDDFVRAAEISSAHEEPLAGIVQGLIQLSR